MHHRALRPYSSGSPLARFMFRHAALAAGPPPQPNAAQIALGLRKLGVAGSVLYVAAHPDDENTALLAYLANGALRAHRLPVAHPRRRRAEPDRLRAGAGAGPHPHAGAAGGAPHRRRRAVLHPRARLRLLEEPRRDAAHLGQGRRAGRRGGGHPQVPPRRDRHPLLARAGRDPRPPHGLGDPGAGGVPRRRRSQVSPRAARRAASTPGRRGGSSGTDRRSSSSRPTTSAATSSWTSTATTRCSASRTARWRPTAAACTRARASAWPARARRSSSTSSCSASSDPKETAREEAAAGNPRRASTSTLKRFAGAARLRGARRQGDREVRSRGAVQASVPALVAIDAALDGDLRRRLARREAARGARADRRLRRAVRRRDGGRLPRGARDGRRGHRDRGRPLAGAGDARRGPVPVRGERRTVAHKLGDAAAGRPDGRRRRGRLRAQADACSCRPTRRRRRRTGWRRRPTPGSTTPIRRSSACPSEPSPVEVDVRLHDRRAHVHRRASGQLQVDRSGDGRALPPAGGDAGGVGSSRRRACLMFPGAAPQTLTVRLVAGAPVGDGRAAARGARRLDRRAGVGAVRARRGRERGGAELPACACRSAGAGTPPRRRSLRVVAEVGGAQLSRGVVRIEHPHIPIQTYLVDADVRLVPRRPGASAARGSATSRAPATRCRPACARSATT